MIKLINGIHKGGKAMAENVKSVNILRDEDNKTSGFLLKFDTEEIQDITLEPYVEKLLNYYITKDTLWIDPLAFPKPNVQMHYLTEHLDKYIKDDFAQLRGIVYGVIDKRKDGGFGDDLVVYRKRHTEHVVRLSKDILERYRVLLREDSRSIPKNKRETLRSIFDNHLEWTVEFIAWMHDMYKLNSSPLPHGKMASIYFNDICKSCGVNRRNRIVQKMKEALIYHSYDKIKLDNIYYEILYEADMLSKWTVDYFMIKSFILNLSLKDVYDLLPHQRDQVYAPFYLEIQQEMDKEIKNTIFAKEKRNDG